MSERFDIAVVGSGPSGISAAGHAAKLGVSHILLEKSPQQSNTIFMYQKGKLVMSTPDSLPLRSDLSFERGKREEVLEAWQTESEKLGIHIRYNADVTSIKKIDGHFALETADGQTVEAENVVLAIGLQGNLRKLDVPGAKEATHLQYQLDDPDEYEQENIAVIGAGDAGIENAVALSDHNHVTMINRDTEFTRAKDANEQAILSLIERGQMDCIYQADTVRVGPGSLTVSTPDGEIEVKVDRIIARLGAIPPRRFLDSIGIEFLSDDPISPPKSSATYESSVPGLYIIGALAGYPLIKQAMNQGYEVVEYILGNDLKPADEPILKERLREFGDVEVETVLENLRETIPILHDLPPLTLRELMLEVDVRRFEAGEVVCKRNDYTNSFLIVVSGSVSIQVNPKNPSNTVPRGPGEFFGEMGLVSGRRRTATVHANETTILLEIPRRPMLKLINSFEATRRTLDEVAIANQIKTHIAPGVSDESLAEIRSTATIQRYKQGELIFAKGDEADGLHLVQKGSVTVSQNIGSKEVVLAYVAAGNYVGEMALISDMPRMATVRAAIATETVKIDGAAFKRLLEREPALQHEIETTYRRRLVDNERMQQSENAGSIIQFLVQQGLGAGTDVLLIDESLCVRCNNCEVACASTHFGVSRLNREAGPTFENIHVPTSCRHCEDPQCMSACPPDAIHRAPNGEVWIDDSCIGCGNCETNCPYDVIQLTAPRRAPPGPIDRLLAIMRGMKVEESSGDQSEGGKIAVKCDMCKRFEEGPACVRACPTGAAFRVKPEEFMSLATLSRRN